MSQNLRQRPVFNHHSVTEPEQDFLSSLVKIARECGQPQSAATEIYRNSDLIFQQLKERGLTNEKFLRLAPSAQRQAVREIRRAVRLHEKKIEQELTAQSFIIPKGSPISLLDTMLGTTLPTPRHSEFEKDCRELERLASNLNLRAESPRASWWHYALDTIEDIAKENSGTVPEFMYNSQLILVEHDWASLLGAALISGAMQEEDTRLPYPSTLFEMQFSGIRIVCMCGQGEEQPTINVMIFMTSIATKHWYSDPGGYELRGTSLVNVRTDKQVDPRTIARMAPLHSKIAAQIRACCAVLDAGIASKLTTTQRNSGLDRKRRASGKSPMTDYVRMNVQRKPRSLPSVLDPNREIIHHRLHFRRGHWRSLEHARFEKWRERTSSNRQWINWQLVGDPDLGWIEKKYRL